MADVRRRDFLRRTSLVLAGGLIVGDAALELFERLSHRKVWALGEIPRRPRYVAIPCTRWDEIAHIMRHKGVANG